MNGLPGFFRRIVLALSLALCAAVALAGGADYEGGDDTGSSGPAYFGFVWDVRGAPLADVRVLLRPKTGATVEVRSNVLGLYRSHVRRDVRPDEVEVSCEKAGYKQTRVVRRAPPGVSAMTIEIDCTLQRL